MDSFYQKKIEDWLKQKCLLFICPACGQRQWNADKLVSGLVNDPPGHVNLRDAQLAPFVPLTCLNCGYTVFFSATVMGLAPTG
jgi:predicted nucleic-acid-binding Zn-ribbon protein